MLTPKVIRFFAGTPGDAAASEQTLKDLTRQIRSFLLARTLINLGLGLVFACFLWQFKVRFPFALGLFAGLTNFVPYVGQFLGGGLPDAGDAGPVRVARRRPDRGLGLPRRW